MKTVKTSKVSTSNPSTGNTLHGKTEPDPVVHFYDVKNGYKAAEGEETKIFVRSYLRFKVDNQNLAKKVIPMVNNWDGQDPGGLLAMIFITAGILEHLSLTYC